MTIKLSQEEVARHLKVQIRKNMTVIDSLMEYEDLEQDLKDINELEIADLIKMKIATDALLATIEELSSVQ